jgi:hypothetical protein
LDKDEDQKKLRETVEKLRPKLLILDPFVRLHRIDENSSGEVAFILASLREIQRTYKTAIMIVHHAKKGAGNSRAGQALRGSSEFHAWGDVNLYLRRNSKDQLTLSIEHRDAKSQTDIRVELIGGKESIALKILSDELVVPAIVSLNEKIDLAFKDAKAPLPLWEIRSKVGARMENVVSAVKMMARNGKLQKVPGGYQLMA